MHSPTFVLFTHLSSCSFIITLHIVVVVQRLSCVWFFLTPQPAAHQDPLFSTTSWSSLEFMSTESVMPSNHLVLCLPLLLLPSIFPSIRVFSNESALHIRWPNSSHNKTNNHFTPIMYIFLLVIFLLIFMVLFGFHFLFGLIYHL